MAIKNQIKLNVQSLSENIGIARVTAATFAAQLDLTLNEIEEIKVAISEAVSNSVIHGYAHPHGKIELIMTIYEDKLEFVITDFGKGISNIEQARQPSYSTDPERMGLGFVFMESFMDNLEIESSVNHGTTIKLTKKITKINSH